MAQDFTLRVSKDNFTWFLTTSGALICIRTTFKTMSPYLRKDELVLRRYCFEIVHDHEFLSYTNKSHEKNNNAIYWGLLSDKHSKRMPR